MRFAAGSAKLLASVLLALGCFESAEAAPGDLLSTARSNVNVRSTPSTDAAIVTRINPGEMIIEIDSQRDWYRIRLPGQDREGWVFAPLMTTISSLETRPITDQAAPSVTILSPVETDPLLETTPSASPTNRLLARLDRFDDSLVGDPKRGETVFVKCGSCHTTVAGVHAQGPNLSGIFGRPPAQASDYTYSGGMQAFAREGGVWDEITLDRFIQRPPRIVKGTSMPFSGLRDPQDRRDVIAYLETLSR